jgi:hypothetical protein
VSFDEKPESLGVGDWVQAQDRSFYVFKVVDGKLDKQPVKIGLRSDLELEVVEGLTEKDTLVARPDSTMRPGMSAKVMRR